MGKGVLSMDSMTAVSAFFFLLVIADADEVTQVSGWAVNEGAYFLRSSDDYYEQ